MALVVCRHPRTGKFLAVEEQGDKGWWLPAGHVDPNETFAQAAYREALEEAGIGLRLEGVLRVEHRLTTPPLKGRLRVVFYGVPIHPDAPLKVQEEEERKASAFVCSNAGNETNGENSRSDNRHQSIDQPTTHPRNQTTHTGRRR